MKKLLFTLAIMLMAIGANAQMKIVTGHPDIRGKIVRCVAQDKTVFIDMIFYNDGNTDATLSISGGTWLSHCFDDDANKYADDDFKVAVGKEIFMATNTTEFPAEGAVKFRIEINNFSTSATEITRMNLNANSELYQSGGAPRTIKITHIPITRE